MGKERASKTDLARLDRMTDAEVARAAREDPDAAPEFTDAMVARAERLVPPLKVPISIRIDRDVLEFFRKQGPNYQRRMNAVLRGFMEASRERGGR